MHSIAEKILISSAKTDDSQIDMWVYVMQQLKPSSFLSHFKDISWTLVDQTAQSAICHLKHIQ